MGEVIHVDFRNKRVTGKSVSGEINPAKVRSEQKDTKSMEEQKKFWRIWLKKYIQMYKRRYDALMAIEATGFSKHDNPLDALNLSLESLVEELVVKNPDAFPEAWQQRPGYFQTVFKEIEARLAKNQD
jgi:hypothetical protein